MSWRPHHWPASLSCTPTYRTSHISTSIEVLHRPLELAQYTSALYHREVASQAMCASFTGKCACFDNAVIESFWATLKRELVYPRERFATRDEARTAIFEFIEVYYNRERLHSSLNYETPETYEYLKQPPEALAGLAA